MNSEFVDGKNLDELTWLTTFDSKVNKLLIMHLPVFAQYLELHTKAAVTAKEE